MTGLTQVSALGHAEIGTKESGNAKKERKKERERERERVSE